MLSFLTCANYIDETDGLKAVLLNISKCDFLKSSMKVSLTNSRHWKHRGVFVLALVGSSFGLSNIWKFPYLISDQGGGTFLLVYFLCLIVVGVPMMMSEALIGRAKHLNPFQAIQSLSVEVGASPHWAWIGLLAILTGVLTFSFYSIVAAWIFYYIFSFFSGLLLDVGVDQSSNHFTAMFGSSKSLLISHSLFMLLVFVVLSAGVRYGLDRAIRYLVPMMLLLLVLLLVYASQTDFFDQAYLHLFSVNLELITFKMLIMALGHTFFTLSLGMGVIMIYGSYLSRSEPIGYSLINVAVLDTLLALMIGLVVLSILLSVRMDPVSGPSLLFIVLPVAFNQIDAGQVLAVLFFLLVGIAAITSAISLLESLTAFIEQQMSIPRYVAAILSVGLAWFISLMMLFSVMLFSVYTLFEMRLFEFLNLLTIYFLLPIVSFALMIFVGWVLGREVTEKELSLSPAPYAAWRFCIRYIVPTVIGLIFVSNLYNAGF